MIEAGEEEEVRAAGTSATVALSGRKMEMNEEAKPKASECPVCLDTYVDPRILPACGHTVCYGCVRKLIHAPPNRTTVACPECRVTSNVPKTGFPKNYRLSDIVAEFQAGIACSSCQRNAPKEEMFHCESCKFEINDGQNIALCGFCSTKHLKANKEHDVVEYGMASQRDIDEAVRQIKNVEPNYLDHSIENSHIRMNELTRKAKEAAQKCEERSHAICVGLLGNEELTKDDLDALKLSAIKLNKIILKSQSKVVSAMTECEEIIREQTEVCERAVSENQDLANGTASTTVSLAATPSTSKETPPSTSAAPTSSSGHAIRTGMKRKLPTAMGFADELRGTGDTNSVFWRYIESLNRNGTL